MSQEINFQEQATADQVDKTNEKVTFYINHIRFNDGTSLQFSPNDIIVFVGPNNAGKSAALNDIRNLVINSNNSRKVIDKVDFNLSGSHSSLLNYIINISKKNNTSGMGFTFEGLGFKLFRLDSKADLLEGTESALGELADIFINTLSTEKRLTVVNPADNIKVSTEALTHPIHFLQKDDKMEADFSAYFKQAFGTDLIVHRNAGKEVPLYVGERPILNEGEDRVSERYISELEKKDLLHHQGDGMRSFVGVMLTAFVAHHPVLLIDEPEAFLHPPQASLLGRMLAKNLPSEKQLFLSTHSESFLKGLLDTNNKNLKIIRVERINKINKISTLDSNDINEIWSDSLLRHSNILDGLFHSKVIICESDSDIRFYSSILSAINEDEGKTNPDILFIQCSGKHRIPIVVKALAKINVPVKVITDFDVLNNENPLRDIYTSLGGDWKDIEKDWRIVKEAINNKRPELETQEVKSHIESILNSVAERIFPKNKINEIQNTLKKASAWAHAKEVGKSFIPSGNETVSYETMNTKLKAKGLLIVEVGELESFVKSIGNHGPKWVNEVLIKDLKNDSELEVARQFVKQLTQLA